MAKRTPIEVQKINGKFRDDKHLPDYAKLPAIENIPMPPPTLNEAAHYVWYSQVSAMQAMRILTATDYILLELFCQQKYLYDMAVESMITSPLVEKTNKDTTKMVNLYIKIQNDAIRNMMDLSKKLGFSPLDRSSIGVKDSQPNDPLKDLLKKQ